MLWSEFCFVFFYILNYLLLCHQIFLHIYFQQTDLKSGDLNSVPKGAHELWTELKESLIKRPVLQGRYRSRFFVQAAHETTYTTIR